MTNISKLWIEILTFSFKKIRLKTSSVKWRPVCPGGDELMSSTNEYSQNLSVWMNNYIHHKVWDAISYPFPNFNGADMKFGNTYVNSSQTLQSISLLSHTEKFPENYFVDDINFNWKNNSFYFRGTRHHGCCLVQTIDWHLLCAKPFAIC